MTYERTVWKNREVERPRTFEKIENPDGTITLVPAEGNIIEPGTPIVAENMNNIEQGIEDAHDLAQQAFQSASNGKILVAGAITGKGVPTDPGDTFQTMADNIFAIETDPSVGTTNAVAGDLLLGKKAVSQGELLTGTMPNKGKVIFTPSREVQTGGKGYYSEIIVETIPPDDTTNAPGNKFLIGGDLSAGYFGVVPASELITGTSLASLVGISAGTSQFSSEGWLKFAYNEKIQFVAKKPIRHSISWDNINAAGCVFGKNVQIGGLTYKVRLMKTGLKDPVSNLTTDMHGSEWNRLMLPIHVRAKDKSWAYPTKVESHIPYWGIDFTDEDLLTHNNFGSGSYSWCQETYTSYRAYRGNYGVSYANFNSPGSTDSYMGWRPVLELVA